MSRAALTLSLMLATSAAPSLALGQTDAEPALRVELSVPDALAEGDRREIVARVFGAGEHPVVVTPSSEGAALEVVRGRLLRSDARDDEGVLELRIPVVARAAGTSVLRVRVAGYACERRCHLVSAHASAVVRVSPRALEPLDDDAPRKQDSLSSAAARSSSLSWVRLPGAEGCVASPQLARAIEARLERSVFVSAADAALAVEGRAERVEDGFRAVIQITDADGESLGDRTLSSRSADCAELGEMVAVTVALMIDPLTAPEPTAAPPVVPVVIVRTERVEVPAERDPVPVEPRPGWRLEIDASLSGAIGLTPNPTLGGITTIVLEPPNFVPIALEGALLPFSRAERNAGGHADFLHLHAGLMICPLFIREGDLALHACVGADAGAVIVVGGDLVLDETERLIGQGHAVVRGHWDVVGPLTIRLAIHLLVPFRHEAFTVAGAPIYAPEPVAGMLDLGVGVHFD